MFQIKVLDLKSVFILGHVPAICTMSLLFVYLFIYLRKAMKIDLNVM
jgi:hypothetical protein